MKRLFIDMDNTITDYNEAAVSWYNKKLGELMRSDELDEYEIWKNYSLHPEEGRKLNREMWDTDGFWRNMEPIRDSLNVIKKLQKEYDIWLVSKPVYNFNCVYEKWEWAKIHLRGLEERLLFIGTDASVLVGDAMVDDDYRRLITFTGKRLLFKQYYNKQMHQNFGFFVMNWKEVWETLHGIV